MEPLEIAKLITDDPDILAEAVIIPELPDLERLIGPFVHRDLNQVKDELNATLEPHRIKFVTTDEFLAQAEEEGLALPPKEGPGIYTAATSPVTGNIFFLYNPRQFPFIPAVEMIEDLLEHELVHQTQVARGARDKVDPDDPESYLANKQEIMAYARSVAKGLEHAPPSDVSYVLVGRIPRRMKREAPHIAHILEMYKDLGGDTWKRFMRYLYDYLRG